MKRTLVNRQSTTRKLLQLFLLCAMLLAPKGVWAQFMSLTGDGSEGNPYTISDASQLKDFADAVNGGTSTDGLYFRIADLMQTATIDCSTITGFTPIGTSQNPFKGTFDGNGSNLSLAYLTVSVSGTGYNGLFGVVDGGTIKNVSLHTCTFTGGNMSGAIVGELISGTIEDCSVISCSVTTSGAVNSPLIGGVVGLNLAGTVSNCTVKGRNTITASTTSEDGIPQAGGVAGEARGGATISGCVVEDATISSSHNECYAGGIVGSCTDYAGYVSITGCSVKGTTTVTCQDSGESEANSAYAGAIAGSKSSNADFSNNYYYYTVKAISLKNNTTTTKENYEHRGLGVGIQDSNSETEYDLFAENGAVMYIKALTLNEQILGFKPNVSGPNEVGYYNRDNNIYYLAPGQTVSVRFNPEGYTVSSATLTYMLDNASAPTTTNLENQGETGYLYSFVMPDADASFIAEVVSTYNVYDLWIGNTQVTENNMNDVLGDNGSVTFTATGGQTTAPVYTLTLNGAELSEPIKIGLDNLTFDIQGTNTITTTTTCIQNTAATFEPSLTFKSTSDEVGSLILKNTDEESHDGVSDIGNVTISRELAPILRNYGNYTSYMYNFTNGGCDETMFVPSYGVKVGDLYVYEGNTTDVLGDGTVSYDQDTHTLTLTNAKVGGSNEGSISTWLPALTIEVVGNNMLISGSQSTLQSLYGENVTMTVQSTGETKGCLVLKMEYSSENVFLGEHVTLETTDPLAVVSGNLNELEQNNLNVVTIGEPVDYELLVEDIRVVAANASNITNDTNRNGRPYASFDAATNTLTLDNSDFNYYWLGSKVPVQSDIQNLKVKLVGDNEVTLGSKVFKYTGPVSETAPTLTFVPELVDDAYGSLEISGTTSPDVIADGYQITNTLSPTEMNPGSTCWLYSVANNSITLRYQEAYGITVTKDDLTVSVTNTNRTNVLGDEGATVQFDGRSRLVLKGADLTSIVVSATNDLPDSGLDIYLEGNNKITNALGYAIESEGAAAMLKLAFHTGGDAPGTLTYTNTGAASENVFPGFEVSYFNKLAKIVNGTMTKVMIPMDLISNDVSDPAIINYGNDPEYSESVNLNNTTIEDILYTLKDLQQQDVADDGLVTGTGGKLSLVINSTMTDLEVVASDAYVPGTQEYYDAFKGLTFYVPASMGAITLYNVMTEQGYAFHVRIGNQEPIKIVNDSNEPRDIVVPYACSDITVVKIYLVNLNAGGQGAPAKKVDHRIGPKSSVAGALGGVKVSNSSVQSSAVNPAAPYKAMEKATMAAAIAGVGDVHNGYTCSDPDITDLPDDMFVDNTPSPAPRRAGSVKTILPDGLTFVDFSGTKITGMEVSRTEGAFNRVPDNVFIYMPAGNSVAKGTKNVVIGGICDVMELNGDVDAEPFKAKKDFKAGQATFKRKFDAYDNDAKAATIYLPYAISQEDANKMGSFYQYVSNDGTTVTMSPVTTGGLKANMPYIFKAKAGGLENPMVRSTEVVANPSETVGFIGVYVCKDYEAGMYCYAAEGNVGQFVEMGTGSYVPPFRAYMIGNGAPSYAILWDGVLENMEEEPNMTAVETVKTAQEKKTAEGWWTLNGVRLSGQPQKPGMYIVDGRLVIVK